MQTRRKTEQIIWAAGFIDGEAYVGITRTKHGDLWYYRVSVSVGQIGREPLEVLKNLFGGSISKSRDGYGHHWQWRVYSTRAVECAKAVLPYLVVKRAQATLMLEFWGICESMPRNGKGQFDHMRSETKELQAQMHALMMGLNRRRERLSEKAPTGNAEGGAIVRPHGNKNYESEAETISPRVVKIR